MDKSDIVIVRIWEGLGNQMFQYAYARALKEKGFDVRLDMNKAYDDIFVKNPMHDVRQVDIQNFNISLPAFDVEKYGKYQYIKRDNIRKKVIYNMARCGMWKYKFYEESINQKGSVPLYSAKTANIKGCCYIKGWFQDERYFRQIRDMLLTELTPRKKIRISKELRQVLLYEESVSVHFRRGDYVKLQQSLDIKYYNEAIARMQKIYKNPLFVIFSEDLDWVKSNLKIRNDCIYVNEDKVLQDYEELVIMSKCKSNIIANSTYSWWGAWLNRNPEKIILAPRSQLRYKQKNMFIV